MKQVLGSHRDLVYCRPVPRGRKRVLQLGRGPSGHNQIWGGDSPGMASDRQEEVDAPPQPPCFCCTGGHLTEPNEQNTQQSP
jgi:hypothetical protein